MIKLFAILRQMRPVDFLPDLLAFAGTVLCAILFRWQAHDLIWSLWISSLTFGYAWMLTAFIRAIVVASGRMKIVATLGGLFTLAFFVLHFSMFHAVHGEFLNEFFPLQAQLAFRPQHLTTLAPIALATYWPFILMTFVSRVRDFPWRNAPKNLGALMFMPYVNVIRMHVIIFVFAALDAAHLTKYAILPILLFYFFPWRIFNRERKALANETPRLPDNI